MTMHSALRNLLEPVYEDSPALKQRLRAVQGQYQRLRTAAYEQFPQLIQPHPEYIYLTLTANCNLRCKGCRYWRDFMPGQQLPLPLVREVLEDIKEAKFEVVRLYGGEPLVHSDIVKIVEYCTELGLRAYLTTVESRSASTAWARTTTSTCNASIASCASRKVSRTCASAMAARSI